MADKTILQGYEALSKARAKQADIAGSFSKAYDFAGRKARKEQEIIDTNNKVADRMNGLEGNINFNAVEDPKLREAVGSFAVLDKDIYANAAIAIGNIKNSADPEYQRLIGQMNDVNNNFNGVRDELVYISTLGAQYQEVMDTEGGFSAGIQNTEEFKAMAEIFGGGGNYSVSVENGHIIYDVNGKKYNASDLALPMKKAFPIAQAILESNKEMYDTNRELNVDDIELLRLRYNNQFANENALRSILSDADFGDIIATEDIDIDEMGVDAARELFVNRLIEANKASARKEYHYYFVISPIDNVATSEIALHLPMNTEEQGDLELLRFACALFVGRHDFYNFSTGDSNAGTTIRQIFYCDIHKANFLPLADNIYYLKIIGDGFLKYMIRYLMGALQALIKGRITIDDIAHYLQEHQQEKLSPKAKSKGLHLIRIEDPEATR